MPLDQIMGLVQSMRRDIDATVSVLEEPMPDVKRARMEAWLGRQRRTLERLSAQIPNERVAPEPPTARPTDRWAKYKAEDVEGNVADVVGISDRLLTVVASRNSDGSHAWTVRLRRYPWTVLDSGIHGNSMDEALEYGIKKSAKL